jgi:hypothetical protein
MEIKTIYKQMDLRREFDEEVNAALAAGWTLTRRDVLDGRPLPDSVFMHRGLYAELVKDNPEEGQKALDLMDAVRMIYNTCLQYDRCADCPLEDICEAEVPYKWDPPAKEVQP